MNQRVDITDIARCYYYLQVGGPNFSPAKAKAALGLEFVPKHNLFYLEPPLRVSRERRWLLSVVRRHSRALRKCGVRRLSFWQVVFLPYHVQENFELTTSALAILSAARVPFCLSIYHDSPTRIMKMPARLYLGKTKAEPGGRANARD